MADMRAGPVEVADHRRARRPVVEVEELRHLPADALDPVGDDLLGVERALGALAARVADQPGGAADEAERPVAGLLEPAQGEQLDEVADVQRGRGRVEPAIERDRPRGEQRPQFVQVGGLRDQAAPRELIQDVGHGLPRLRLLPCVRRLPGGPCHANDIQRPPASDRRQRAPASGRDPARSVRLGAGRHSAAQRRRLIAVTTDRPRDTQSGRRGLGPAARPARRRERRRYVHDVAAGCRPPSPVVATSPLPRYVPPVRGDGRVAAIQNRHGRPAPSPRCAGPSGWRRGRPVTGVDAQRTVRGAHVQAVLLPGDAERLAEPGGAAGQVPDGGARAPRLRRLHPLDDLAGAEQHGRRRARPGRTRGSRRSACRR